MGACHTLKMINQKCILGLGRTEGRTEGRAEGRIEGRTEVEVETVIQISHLRLESGFLFLPEHCHRAD